MTRERKKLLMALLKQYKGQRKVVNQATTETSLRSDGTSNAHGYRLQVFADNPGKIMNKINSILRASDLFKKFKISMVHINVDQQY